jgi:hypothetical protein
MRTPLPLAVGLVLLLVLGGGRVAAAGSATGPGARGAWFGSGDDAGTGHDAESDGHSGHGGDHEHGRYRMLPFRVGAAAVDVTPPLDGAAPNPAACAGAEAYTGPHLLSLEEPYTDTNGNGRYDKGEPYLDCATPAALGGEIPPDHRWDGIFLGGGNCCDRRPTAVLDPLWARTLVVAGRGGTLSLTSVDNEGVFKEIWDQVRAKVRADGVTGIDAMLFSSTHDESAPDTIGISGPTEFVSGVDPFYVQFLIERTAQSIEDAYAALQPAAIRFGQVRPDDMVTCWSSYPFAADEQIGVMQATDRRGRPIATLVNYGIHAEELGFSDDDQDRLHLSSDWHHFARQALEAYYGGVAITVAGAVGSVEMPQIYPTPRDHTPVDLYSSQGNGGCRTIYATDDTRVPYGYDLSTRARGERIATWAERAIRRGRRSKSNVVDARRQTIFLPLDNALFGFATTVGVIPGKIPFLDDVELMRAPNGKIDPPTTPNEFQTDVAWFRIGDADFVSAPGEVFPYTYVRDFGGPDDQAVPDGAEPPPWIMARLSQPFRFIVGLGEDMVGYIFPKTNAVGVPLSLGDTSDVDRFGCGHSDDGEAAAVNAGDLIAATLAGLLPDTRDRTRVGRYVDRDGGLHRSPLGDGGQACTGPGNVFHPIPGGEAVAVWILPPGTTAFAPGVGRRIEVREHGPWRWMDLRGRPEPHASTQTRGVIGPHDRRIWVDVFPDTTGP